MLRRALRLLQPELSAPLLAAGADKVTQPQPVAAFVALIVAVSGPTPHDAAEAWVDVLYNHAKVAVGDLWDGLVLAVGLLDALFADVVKRFAVASVSGDFEVRRELLPLLEVWMSVVRRGYATPTGGAALAAIEVGNQWMRDGRRDEAADLMDRAVKWCAPALELGADPATLWFDATALYPEFEPVFDHEKRIELPFANPELDPFEKEFDEETGSLSVDDFDGVFDATFDDYCTDEFAVVVDDDEDDFDSEVDRLLFEGSDEGDGFADPLPVYVGGSSPFRRPASALPRPKAMMAFRVHAAAVAIFVDAGRYQEAVGLVDQCSLVEFAERVAGVAPEAPLLLRAPLVAAYRGLDRLADALEQALAAVSELDRRVGPASDQTIAMVSQAVRLCTETQQLDAAIEIAEFRYAAVVGAANPLAEAQVALLYAGCLDVGGHHDRAVEVATAAHVEAERTLGPTHPFTLLLRLTAGIDPE